MCVRACPVFLTFLSRQFFKEILLKESRWPINNRRHGFKSRLQKAQLHLNPRIKGQTPFFKRRIFPARAQARSETYLRQRTLKLRNRLGRKFSPQKSLFSRSCKKLSFLHFWVTFRRTSSVNLRHVMKDVVSKDGAGPNGEVTPNYITVRSTLEPYVWDSTCL